MIFIKGDKKPASQVATPQEANVLPQVPWYSFISRHEYYSKELPSNKTNIPLTNSGSPNEAKQLVSPATQKSAIIKNCTTEKKLKGNIPCPLRYWLYLFLNFWYYINKGLLLL